jgi:hypothetical protein
MMNIDLERLSNFRIETYHLPPANPVRNPSEALDFVNERGFIFFWPITSIDLPSLWIAVAGNRPVADEHDDPGHVTWSWKDNSLDKKIWYYAKILHRKATFVSLEFAPYFYALSENYGSPEEDHIIAYEAGHLTLAAKQIYDALLENGPLNTVDLRKAARLQNAKESEFNRAIEALQKDFKLLPVGIAEAGAWRYAYRYDLTARHFPELPGLARPIGEADARQKIAEFYVRSVGAAQTRDLQKLFSWPLELVKRTLEGLIRDGKLVEALHPQKAGTWLTLVELV